MKTMIGLIYKRHMERKIIMAEKLYAVTAGAYSAYHIISLCSDKARAEQIRDIYNRDKEEDGFGSASIEEYADGIRIDLDKSLYEVKLSNDGMKETVRLCSDEEKIDTMCDAGYSYRLKVTQRPMELAIYIIADDRDIALKIARDRFAQYKAEREGIT